MPSKWWLNSKATLASKHSIGAFPRPAPRRKKISCFDHSGSRRYITRSTANLRLKLRLECLHDASFDGILLAWLAEINPKKRKRNLKRSSGVLCTMVRSDIASLPVFAIHAAPTNMFELRLGSRIGNTRTARFADPKHLVRPTGELLRRSFNDNEE